MKIIHLGIFIASLLFILPCRADVTKVVAQDGSGDLF